MNTIYNPRKTTRSREEWQSLLDLLLNDLAGHIGIELLRCSYFIEDQSSDEKSFGCHLDFRGTLSAALGLEMCGILSYNVNWGESVGIGADLLYFQNGHRLHATSNSDSVHYMARSDEGWRKPHVEFGNGNEWLHYATTERWDGCNASFQRKS